LRAAREEERMKAEKVAQHATESSGSSLQLYVAVGCHCKRRKNVSNALAHNSLY